MYGPIPQIVWVNDEDAQAVKIQEGDEVVLYNERGRVVVKAMVNKKVKRGVLWAPRPLTGIGGNPLNVLAPCVSRQIGGGPAFSHIKVRMKKAAG